MLSVTLKAARGQGVVFVPCSRRHHVSTHNHFFSSWWQEAVYLHTEMNIFLSRWQYDNLWKFNHYYVVKQSLIPFSICTFYFHFDIFEELLEELGSFFQFSSVAQSCLTLCDPMNRSTPGLPIHHQHPESTETHVHRVSDAIQASLSITNTRSPLRLTFIESVMPSSHFIFCRPLLLLPPIPPSIRVFYNESTLCMNVPHLWPMDCSWPCNSVHWISQARLLEWIAISYSRGSSQPGSWTCVSCTGSQILYHYTTW